jgi:hypothetical protein
MGANDDDDDDDIGESLGRKRHRRGSRADEDDDESDDDDDDDDDDDSDDDEDDAESDDSDDASDDDDGALELTLDERGRAACALNPRLAYDARARRMFLTLGARATTLGARERLIEECATAHTAKNAKKAGEYSSGRTFWVGADATPRCALEALALATFRAATRRAMTSSDGEDEEGTSSVSAAAAAVAYDASRSGAEWWTQVISDGDEIGWHWDKDYALEGSEVNLHPHLGTVTYLCDYGAPTVIVDRATEVHYEGEGGDLAVRGAVSTCAVSWPKFGKQITFDGKLLHGAPMELATRLTPGVSSNGKRVTFLVNIWLNYKPITAAPLTDDELCGMKMRDVDEATSWTTDNPEDFVHVEASPKTSEQFEFTFQYAKCKRTLALTLPSTFRDGVWCAESGDDCALVEACHVGELR